MVTSKSYKFHMHYSFSVSYTALSVFVTVFTMGMGFFPLGFL